MPKWMDDCVKRVKKENPNYSDSRAWAICTAAYKKKFGHAPSREGGDVVGDRVLTESYKSHLVVESVDDEASNGFAFTISGTVIPAPTTDHGTYSRNHRLYPQECVKETYIRSQEFLRENVATVHGTHAAAGPFSDKLPLGKVTELWLDDGALKFRAGFANTSEGRDVCSLIESGVLERVSLRTRSWKSRFEEVDDLGEVEVMEWAVIHGIDFAEVPGLDGTQVVKEHEESEEEEEQDMELNELTLAQLQEARPDLIAEIVEGHAPEPTVEFQTPPDVSLELAMHRASNKGAGSLVFEYLQEHVEDEAELTEEVLQKAREHAAQALYGRHAPAPPTNLKGEGSPAPEPQDDEGEDEEQLSEAQQEMLHLAGGG